MTAGTGRPRIRALTPGTPPNRLLRFGLIVVAVVPTLIGFWELVRVHMPGIDLEIPLRAAARWTSGGQPYLASSFAAPPGPDLPFLYPPVVLPFVSLLLALPRQLLLYGWVAICLLAAAWACRRLRIPPVWWPAVLIAPPFAEGIIGGNVQILLFAAFVALFYRAADGEADLHPVWRDPSRPEAGAARDGILATVIAVFKVSELHPWAWLAVRRPSAALTGAGLALLLVLVTLPFVGLQTWFDWLAQARRAADPNWQLAGISVGRYLPGVVALGITALSVVLLVVVPRRDPGAWVGLLAVLGAPSLHVFGVLFMLPAWLSIRREAAILAGFFVGTFTELGMWLGIGITAVAFVAGQRWPALLEPPPLASIRPAVVASTVSPAPA
ncbi:MAG TPA: glycosyltransferase 87 family protein [Candidatus Limnocylindrales bacterium]|nr:glycosyltransferase 87 family protein [Candidatus Limnocylindrales bacterium]